MSATFPLEILTPEHQFFTGEVEALTVTSVDGELTVLKGHAPITAPLAVGKIKIKQADQWREAFQSEGFLEAGPWGAKLFVQACEWPENIDTRRAEAARKRAEERLRQKRSMQEYRSSQIALSRAMARLRMSSRQGHGM
ncbi:MAG: ATP synthase F1 subunit epsilon [Clostridia bacterium]|nr:ATP synthase F1 subunit epsilon [Clostridia bacterium]